MNSFLKKILRGDTTIWLVFLLLCIGSALIMYSASSTLAYKASSYSKPMLQHAGYLALGIGLAYGIHLIPYKIIRVLSYLGIIVSIVFLILVQFKGITENGATRWFSLFGFQFQPSEIAKLSLIMVVADFISRIKDNDSESERVWFRRIMLLSGFICLIIFKDNISTALLLLGIIFCMMFIGRISFKRLGIIVLVVFALCISGYGVGKAMLSLPSESAINKLPLVNRLPTMTGRIDRFFIGEENADKYKITDATLQPKRSMIAIANGGIFGVGPGNSVQRDYLPQAYSDFIYAIVIEEGGLLVGIFLILLYLILLFRAGQIATKCDSVFPALLVIGLCLMVVFQAFISMAVATGLGPVTGQPLPLISRGGTSIIITSVYFGIILGVTRQIKENGRKQAEETASEIPLVELDEI